MESVQDQISRREVVSTSSPARWGSGRRLWVALRRWDMVSELFSSRTISLSLSLMCLHPDFISVVLILFVVS